MAGIFFLTQEGRDPKWSCELLSLADGGVAVHSGVGWSWAPEKGDLQWLAIDDAPGDSDRLRLRQMKEIAGRYEITTSEGTLKSQLRLMVQPLFRYADEERGLIDGAIFLICLRDKSRSPAARGMPQGGECCPPGRPHSCDSEQAPAKRGKGRQ